MSGSRKLLVVIFVIITVVASNAPLWVLAHAPGIWSKTDGVNEITPALTKDTSTFWDDDGSDFVHEIQWANTPLGNVSNWRAEADTNANTTIEVVEALNWVCTSIANATDQENYGVADAWANPEQTLNQGSGDSEDKAFLLASLLKWNTDEVNTGEGDLVSAVCGFIPPIEELYAWVSWYDASLDEWHLLDPIICEVNGTLDAALGMLWLNDEYVLGFLPGYYPGPLPQVPGYDRDDFCRIAEGGFNDPMNNYAFSMAEFKGDVYVGTNRNFLCQVLEVLQAAGLIPPDYEFQHITCAGGDPLSLERAQDMCAEIWRYGSWERVYRSEPVDVSLLFGWPPGSAWAAREPGFRSMIAFTDRWGEEAIYAASGLSMVPGRLLLKSIYGTTWEEVVTPLAMGSDSRSMAVHNGKLCIGTALFGANATIWATDDPATTGDGSNWQMVADFTAEGPGTNVAVESMASFNGYLYAGTLNDEAGFQVWRSNATIPDDPVLGEWTKIVDNGAGDMKNYLAGTMEVFNNRLYVGSMSLPLSIDGTPEFLFPKGFELIRIDTEDNWELLIGDYVSRLPPSGNLTFRLPMSGWPGGFANPFNFYCWSLEEEDGVLYLGTFDASSFLQFLPIEDIVEELSQMEEFGDFFDCIEDFFIWIEEHQEEIVFGLECVIGLLEEHEVDEYYIEPYRQLLEAFQSEPIDWEAVWQVFIGFFAGADLWKTEDGIWWEPVTLNGFDNPNNYGFRNMLSVNPLFIGTANPFGGLEVWRAPCPPPVGGIVEPVDPLELGAISGEPSDGASTSTFVALGIGMAVLFAAFLIWSVRRRRVTGADKSQ